MERRPRKEPVAFKIMKNNGSNNPGIDVAFFLQDLAGGGAEKIMASLANEFVGRGLRVDFVLVHATGVNLKLLSEKIRVVDLRAKNTYVCLPALVRYLRQSRPRVFLSSLDLTNLMALIARKISKVNTRLVIRIEVLVSAQKRSFFKKKLEKLLLTILYPWADDVVAISKNVAEDIIDYARLLPTKIHVLFNPVVTPDLLNKAKEDSGHTWLKKGQPPVILGAGRLTEQKDFETLLQSFAILRRKMEARLIILGEGEQRTVLETVVRHLDIEKDVDLHGYVENPYSFMRQSSVFVLSSKWEGSPAVVIAALACGCPVISTDCPGGVREILADGAYGDFVPVGNATAMAEAIEKVLVSGGKKIPPKWLDQFSIENIAEQALKVLKLS
jgi:glycosyltransferase involved in cell wall biosynthesis